MNDNNTLRVFSFALLTLFIAEFAPAGAYAEFRQTPAFMRVPAISLTESGAQQALSGDSARAQTSRLRPPRINLGMSTTQLTFHLGLLSAGVACLAVDDDDDWDFTEGAVCGTAIGFSVAGLALSTAGIVSSAKELSARKHGTNDPAKLRFSRFATALSTLRSTWWTIEMISGFAAIEDDPDVAAALIPIASIMTAFNVWALVESIRDLKAHKRVRFEPVSFQQSKKRVEWGPGYVRF